jgi:hypothetical protein
MSIKIRRFLLMPAVAILLSACGGTSTRGPELLSARNSPTSAAVSTITPAPTQTSAPLPSPTVEVTLAPVTPFPGLVYSKADGTELWIVEADGTAKQLTAKPGARLSPDQSTILYVEYGDVWSSELNATKVLNLTRTNDKIECCAQWWPAHPGIVVFHFQYKNQNQPVAGYLAMVKTDGTNFLILDEDIGSMTPAALSPDGQSIAYDRAGQPWIYNFQGGSMPLFRKSAGLDFRVAVDPAWSPDGRKLAWQFYGDQAGTNGWSETDVLDLDSYQIAPLHRYTLHPDSPVYSRLAWSPDGKWLAVAGEAELGQDGKVSLWILPPGGSDVHALGVGDQPVWSPDGTQLIYQSGGQNFGVKAGEWIPFPVTLPADSLVIDWVAVK